MTSVLFATTNPYKVREVRAALEPLGIQVISLDSLPGSIPEPVEDESTFEGNASLKARYYARQTGLECLGEDSGLVVDALGGAPGILSARYAGTAGSREERDRANNEKLLVELASVPRERRSARFICALCLAAPDGRILASSTGTFEGVIADAPRGENGFGYDPLLFLPDLGCTSAELSPEQKNARSHRGKAVAALAEKLRARRA